MFSKKIITIMIIASFLLISCGKKGPIFPPEKTVNTTSETQN